MGDVTISHDDRTTSTYFLVTTVDTDNPEDAIALARHMDEPTEAPTIDELAARIRAEITRYALEAERAAAAGQRLDPVKDAAVARIIEIVTLGNVPATATYATVGELAASSAEWAASWPPAFDYRSVPNVALAIRDCTCIPDDECNPGCQYCRYVDLEYGCPALDVDEGIRFGPTGNNV